MKLYSNGILVISVIAIHAIGFAATTKPKLDDKMETVTADKEDTKGTQAQKEYKVFARAGYTEESKTASTPGLRFIDFAPEYYAHKAKLLIATAPYTFGTQEIHVLYLPSGVDCVIAYCLTENANKLLRSNQMSPWHSIELDGKAINFSSDDQTRYAIRATTSNNKTPCSLYTLKLAYTEIIKQVTTGWQKDPRSYSGYACWAKKQTLRHEDLLIRGLAYKTHLFEGQRLSDQLQCSAKNGRIDLQVTLKALPTFTSKLWQLPNA